MKIVCLGDSITGVSNLEKYLKWSHVLECMIDAKAGEWSVTVVNRGIGGDTTGGVLKRLGKDVLDEQPDIVVILLGGNDARKKIERAEVRANYEQIIERTKANGAKILLMQYHALPNPEMPEKAWTDLQDNNDLIAEMGDKYQLPVLSLAEPMQQALKKYRLPELVNSEDGVHLNSAGELVLARNVFKKLVELGWI